MTTSSLLSDFALIGAWRDHLIALGRSPSTLRLYTSAITRLGAEVVQGPITTTTEEQIDAFMVGLGKHGRAKVLAAHAFRGFFGWLRRRGHIDSDPSLACDGIKSPEPLPAVVLEEDELIRYLIAAANRSPRRAWAIMLTFAIGCRRAELAGIAPYDVFSDRVRLRKTKGSRPRDVELNSLARTAIEELRPWYSEHSILGGIVPQVVTQWCREAAVDAGLEHKVARRPTHVLRASFATHLLRQGVRIDVVSRLMGHRDVKTTMVYLALVPGERQAAVDRLPFAS